ncbi:MAG: RNA 2',3'-cyclic phosphodiesterase [Thermodesulfobacteriota bacterium]
MRLFVALELPEPAKAAAAGVMAELKRAGADLKWVDPANLHLTLKFLGETPPERLDEITVALQRALTGAPPLELGLAGAGAFPGLGRPQVVWLGVNGQADRLAALAAAIQTALAGLGFPPEGRAFQAHLTLARARRGRGKPGPPPRSLAQALAGLAGWRGPEFLAERVALMESTLTPAGPIYRPRWVYALGGGPLAEPAC